MKLFSSRKNIVLGVVFSYISLAISLIGAFFITPVILRNIGDRNYGLFSFCNSITSWLSIISVSLGASYVFFASKEKKEHDSESTTNTIFSKLLFLLSGIVALLTVFALAILYFSGFRFANYSSDENTIIFLLLLISSLNVSITIFFSGFILYNNYTKSFAFVRGVQIIVSLGSYATNLILAMTTKSIIPIAIVSFLSAFFTGLVNMFYSLRAKKMTFNKSEKLKKNKQLLKLISKYSSIILISTIITNLDSNLDKTLLGFMVNAESVTMYQLSINFATHLLVLSFSFTEVMRPTFFGMYRNEQIDAANDLFLKICKMQSVVVFLIVGGYIACGYHFVIMWIGTERIDVYYYSVALFVSNIVPLTKSMDGEAQKATNHHKTPMFFSIIGIIINLGLSISLIVILPKEYAVWACIIGTIVPRFIFGCVVTPIYNSKVIKLPMSKYYSDILKMFLITYCAVVPSIRLTSLLSDYEIHNAIKVLIEGLTFVFIYGFGVYLLNKKTVLDIINTYFRRKSA